MKKIFNISVVMAIILVMSTAVFAMDMNSSGGGMGEMKGSIKDGIAMMEKGFSNMDRGAELMHNQATLKEGLNFMNKEMMAMHKGMKMIENGAEEAKKTMIKGSMERANEGMMEMMKGMGMVKKGDDQGFQMMNRGLEKMERSLAEVKGMSGN